MQRARMPFYPIVAILGLSPVVAHGQEYHFGASEALGTRIASVGGAMVVEASGPPLVGRREIYRPVPPLRLRSRWLMVQDSVMGLVFDAPGGIEAGVDEYVGDLHLRSLVAVRAFEVRTFVFNVWGELDGYLSFTVLDERGAGSSWTLRPEWEEMPQAAQHRTSVVWVHRVMFEDESVLEADDGPLAIGWLHVTGSEMEALPRESPVPASAR